MTISLLNELLLKIMEVGASDLHLSVGAFPAVRRKGVIEFQRNLPKITQNDIEGIISAIAHKEMKEELIKNNNCAFSYAIPHRGRFRVCIYKQRGTYFITFRVSNFNTPTKEALRLPDETDKLFSIDSGLILITGTKGSGTTSTSAYIIDKFRKERKCHIVTIEDPIEYLFNHDKSIISQMEVGIDVNNMYTGIEVALKDNADIIYLSSIMDVPTIRLALEAARSGKIVVTTMDIPGVVEVIRSIIDIFPSESANYIRALLSQSIKCIISQQLVPDIEGNMIPICEVLYGVKAVANLIRENKIVQIDKVLETSLKIDMLSKDNHLLKLYRRGLISEEILKDFAQNWDVLSMSIAKIDER